jgi:cullin-4
MQSELDEFAAFYNEKHQGHKIEWSHTLGTVSLRAHFAAGQKELSVSLYQAVILFLFNDMVEIPFSDVKLHTGIGMSMSFICRVHVSSRRVILSSTVPPVN